MTRPYEFDQNASGGADANEFEQMPLLTKDQFGKAVVDRITKGGEKSHLTYDSDSFCLVSDDVVGFYLTGAYKDFQHAQPNRRAAVIEHSVCTWFSL